MLNARESAGSKPAVVLIHGGIDPESFVPLMPVEALRSYHLIRVRRRAYGQHAGTVFPVTIAQDAADTINLLDELNISAAHFVGHSHGALVTLESALRYPQRVLSLTLLEAGLIAVVPSAPLAAPAFEPVMRRYADGQPVEALRALSRVIFGPDWRDDLRGDSAVALVNAKATFESDFASMPLWNFPETARGVCQPVLSILGGLSDATFVQTLGFPAVSEVRELLDRFIPHCRHVVLTNLNHALQMTDPIAVGNAIGSFLDCLPATTHE